MKVNHKLKIDLVRSGITPRLHAVQSDALSRVVSLQLFADGRPWSIPRDVKALISFRKSDGTGGVYDTLPDGSSAWRAQGSSLHITLAPQVLTAPGETVLAVTLVQLDAQLTTLTAVVEVKRRPDFTGTSESYSYVTAFLPQPEKGAAVGKLLRVSEVDSLGRVLAMEAVSGGSGLGADSSELLLKVLKSALYTEDVSQTLIQLEESFAQPEVVLTGISVVYAGGAVTAGTAVSALTDITVTAQYSDGSSAPVTGYTLSGTIREGNNTITVSFGGFTDSFAVTGIAVATDPDSYSVQNNLTNATNSNTATTVAAGAAYSCTVKAAEGYVLKSIVITMGGAQVVNKTFTAAPLETGWSVEAVTGDIVITAVAEAMVTLTGIRAVYTGGEVDAGTALTDLQGITVTAQYSDGSSAAVADYTLSGTIAEGENTVTVSYGGFSDSFTVTGIAVSASYKLVNSWDLSSSLTDSVGGLTAITTGTQDNSGITFTAGSKYVQLNSEPQSILGKAVELDIVSGNLTTPTSQHARLFGIANNPGITNTGAACFLWRYNTSPGWAFYYGNLMPVGWGESVDSGEYPIDFFHGKTLRLEFGEAGGITAFYAPIGESNFTAIHKWESALGHTSGYFVIGGSANNDIYPITVSGVRIYEKEA